MVHEGELVDLSRRVDYPILHLYSPEAENEISQVLSKFTMNLYHDTKNSISCSNDFEVPLKWVQGSLHTCSLISLGEIEVFIAEHGLRKTHTIYQPCSSEDLLNETEKFISEKSLSMRAKKLTIIIWGHGNRLDEKNGFYKVFNKTGDFEHLFLNDWITMLAQWAVQYQANIQLLMTQCWAHCHDFRIHQKCPSLTVDWLSSETTPETSARRWDHVASGKEMSQEVFEGFIEDEKNFEKLHLLTHKKYKDSKRKLFLKYLHFSSIHVEATCYVHNQRQYN